MRKNWMYALSLLLMPLWGHAEEEEPRSFQEVVLAVLGEQVQDLGSAYSQGVVKLIAQESGLDDAEVRSKLVELLDGLDAQRKGKTDAWKDVVAAGGKDIEAKKVDKFFKELSKELHKVVGKKGDYALESLVGKAASKARIQNYEGEDILVRLLGPEDASSSLVSVELPEKIGIVVTGESSYAIDREGFEDLLITSQDRLTFNKVRDIHVPIATQLTEAMSGSGRVKWALEKVDPKLVPDCTLFFEIDWFSARSNASGGGQPATQTQQPAGDPQADEDQGTAGGQPTGTLPPIGGQQNLPMLFMTAQIILEHTPSKAMLFRNKLEVTYDFNRELDDQIRSQRLLDKFYKQAAREMRKELDNFLAGQ